jgi:hypothetical protein
MNNQFQMLRTKMEKYNSWEAENRLSLSAIKRLEQFVMLYDLGKMHDEKIVRQMNEEHLNSILEITHRLKHASCI